MSSKSQDKSRRVCQNLAYRLSKARGREEPGYCMVRPEEKGSGLSTNGIPNMGKESFKIQRKGVKGEKGLRQISNNKEEERTWPTLPNQKKNNSRELRERLLEGYRQVQMGFQ